MVFVRCEVVIDVAGVVGVIFLLILAFTNTSAATVIIWIISGVLLLLLHFVDVFVLVAIGCSTGATHLHFCS